MVTPNERRATPSGAFSGPTRRAGAVFAPSSVCAGHGTKLERCKSSYQVYAEPKVRRRARASSRGGVWRKPNSKLRGDVQEPDLRCGTPGTSWHVTAKSSICLWGVLYKSGVYAVKVSCLTPGGLHVVQGSTDAEVIQPDRHAEVSRGHSSEGSGKAI